jgi:O-methyltransferase
MKKTYTTRLLRASIYSLTKGIGLPFVRRVAVRTGAHEMVFPYATYSPWLQDDAFASVHRKLAQYTLVDLWRCYELWQLVEQVRDVPGALLEVGVWRGGTGALIAARAKELGIGEKVYLCDTFTGVVKTSKVDTYYRGGEHADTSEVVVRTLLDRLELMNVQVLTGIYPEETAAGVVEEHLRLVHIDVDVYGSAREVLEHVWPQLSVGGVVVFDDYGFASCPGVTRLVDEQREIPGRLVIQNLNGHGILIKQF